MCGYVHTHTWVTLWISLSSQAAGESGKSGTTKKGWKFRVG